MVLEIMYFIVDDDLACSPKKLPNSNLFLRTKTKNVKLLRKYSRENFNRLSYNNIQVDVYAFISLIDNNQKRIIQEVFKVYKN